MAKKKGEAPSGAASSSARAKSTDPLQLWREWIDRTERHWNSTLNELTTSESFSQAQSRLFDSVLALQSQMNSATERYFSVINLPSRTDILSLGHQLAAIEERLVDLEGRLQDLSDRLPGSEKTVAPPLPTVRRTRKAPRPAETKHAEPSEPHRDEKKTKKSETKKSKTRTKKAKAKKAQKRVSKKAKKAGS